MGTERFGFVWKLLNTMDPAFCVEALGRAFRRFSPPANFNTDEGCQFIRAAFTRRLGPAKIVISMGGRG
jgi:putative transposase